MQSCEARILLGESDFPHVYDPMKTLDFKAPRFSDSEDEDLAAASRFQAPHPKFPSVNTCQAGDSPCGPFIDLIDGLLASDSAGSRAACIESQEVSFVV